MKALVIDACLALGFVLPDEQEPLANKVMARMEKGAPTVVPAHWMAEVTNGIVMAERRDRLTQSQTTVALQLVASLPVEVDSKAATKVGGDVAALARQFRLTAYDAAYLELAMRAGADLATSDKALRRAAQKVGVHLA